MTQNFADHAQRYARAGWDAALPFPAGQKFPPPVGYTGRSRRTPTGADHTRWAIGFPEFNVGLQLPDGYIGVDVDAYGDKPGKSTLADLEAKWGVLPDTWISTSRDDGVSGIRLYALPQDAVGLDWPGGAGPGIDLVRPTHRYMMVAPSVHPSGRPYQWVAPDAEQAAGETLPHAGALPELPHAWISGLTGGRSAVHRGPRANVTDATVSDWLETLSDLPACTDVEYSLQKAQADHDRGKSRHDNMNDSVMGLVSRGHNGCTGVPTALETLHDMFTAWHAADPERQGNAQEEWDRSFQGAVSIILGKSTVEPRPCSGAVSLSFWEERPVLQYLHDFARASRVPPSSMLGVVLARTVAQLPSWIHLPNEGTPNLLVALVGESGTGKSKSIRAAAKAISFEHIDDALSKRPVEPQPVGSGEGLVQSYVQFNTKTKLMERSRDSALYEIDEIDSLSAQASRTGTTIVSVLKSAWSGGLIGQTNASAERNRVVQAGTYRFAAYMGVQPLKSDMIFDDADGGLPQRFLWLPAVDPEMPRVRPAYPTYKPKAMRLPQRAGEQDFEIRVCQVALDAVDEAAYLSMSGRGDVDTLDMHSTYTRLKVAAALGFLDGRWDVDEDDWRIAGKIMALSDATRGRIVTQRRERAAESALRRGKEAARVNLAMADEETDQRAQQAANAIIAVLRSTPTKSITRADLTKRTSKYKGGSRDDGLAILTNENKIRTETTPAGGSIYTLTIKEN